MTSRSPRMDPKGIAQELLGPISPLRQEMASVEDNVPGPGRAMSWWEEGHYSYSSDSSIMFNHIQGLQGSGDCARPHFSVISAGSSQQLREIQCSAKRQIPSKNKVFVQVTRPL